MTVARNTKTAAEALITRTPKARNTKTVVEVLVPADAPAPTPLSRRRRLVNVVSC